MSVEIQRTDDWLSQLAFSSPRPSPFGLIDGLWWGMMSGNGDASGGVLAFDGDLSEARKTDWVRILGGWSVRSPSTTAVASCYIEFQTGPKIVGNQAGIDRPTFSAVGDMREFPDSADPMISVTNAGSGQPLIGIPLYADPALPGPYELLHVSTDPNVNGKLTTVSLWGFLIRYQTFFRGIPPGIS